MKCVHQEDAWSNPALLASPSQGPECGGSQLPSLHSAEDLSQLSEEKAVADLPYSARREGFPRCVQLSVLK